MGMQGSCCFQSLAINCRRLNTIASVKRIAPLRRSDCEQWRMGYNSRTASSNLNKMSARLLTSRISKSLPSSLQTRTQKISVLFRSQNPMASQPGSTQRQSSSITSVFSKDSVPREFFLPPLPPSDRYSEANIRFVSHWSVCEYSLIALLWWSRDHPWLRSSHTRSKPMDWCGCLDKFREIPKASWLKARWQRKRTKCARIHVQSLKRLDQVSTRL